MELSSVVPDTATSIDTVVRLYHDPENRKSYDSDSLRYSLRIIGLFSEKTPAFYDFLPIFSRIAAYVFPASSFILHSRKEPEQLLGLYQLLFDVQATSNIYVHIYEQDIVYA